MAKRPVGLRGRSVVALLLLGFVLVAVGIIWRRSVGVGRERELEALKDQRLELEALRAKLLRDIRYASSRGTLAPLAERRLDMHVAADSQYVILPRPARP